MSPRSTQTSNEALPPTREVQSPLHTQLKESRSGPTLTEPAMVLQELTPASPLISRLGAAEEA